MLQKWASSSLLKAYTPDQINLLIFIVSSSSTDKKVDFFCRFGYCHFNHTVDFSYVRSAKLSLDRGRIFCDDDTGQCASLDARVGKLQPTESP